MLTRARARRTPTSHYWQLWRSQDLPLSFRSLLLQATLTRFCFVQKFPTYAFVARAVTVRLFLFRVPGEARTFFFPHCAVAFYRFSTLSTPILCNRPTFKATST